MTPASRAPVACFLVLAALASAAGCSEPLETQLEHLMASRRIAADISLDAAKAADATNRAVMAGTDETAAAFAKEARESMAAVDSNTTRLRDVLQALQFADESRDLDEFDAAFKKYRDLNTAVLDLAVQNTNLKAQRLSFGPAADAAEAFISTLKSLGPASASDSWRLRAVVAEAVAGIRQIQILEAPHIAEADDAVMSAFEQRMAQSERDVRSALGVAGSVASSATRGKVAQASAELDRFMTIHAELITLSRTNSNVRSLALALGQTRHISASCQATLQTLRKALDERSLGASR